MLKDLFDSIRKYNLYRQTYKELNSMTEEELRDIGINKYEIEEIARGSAYGDVLKYS